MPQRLAIIAASVVATIVLTVGLVAAGFAPPSDSASVAAKPEAQAASAASGSALEPKVVYVKPAPKPKTIVRKKQATAGRATVSSTRTKTVVAAPRRSDDDHGERHERGERGEEHDD